MSELEPVEDLLQGLAKRAKRVEEGDIEIHIGLRGDYGVIAQMVINVGDIGQECARSLGDFIHQQLANFGNSIAEGYAEYVREHSGDMPADHPGGQPN